MARGIVMTRAQCHRLRTQLRHPCDTCQLIHNSFMILQVQVSLFVLILEGMLDMKRQESFCRKKTKLWQALYHLIYRLFVSSYAPPPSLSTHPFHLLSHHHHILFPLLSPPPMNPALSSQLPTTLSTTPFHLLPLSSLSTLYYLFGKQ